MPILKKDGREIRIPFNPQAIGQLLYEGYEVFPDPDTSPERARAENELIVGELRQLWGDQWMRTVPGRREETENVLGWDQDFGWKDTLPIPKSTDFMKVLPNPNVIYRTPTLQNNPKPPGMLEAGLKDVSGGSLSDLALMKKWLDREKG
jgi:hypothetical protein